MRMFHRLLAASLLAWLPGCGSSVPTRPQALRCRSPVLCQY
jgi:hypothetical protein